MPSSVWKEKVGSYGNTVTVREATWGGNVRLEAWDSRAGYARTRSLGFPVRDAEGELMDEAVQEAREKAIELSNRLRLDQVPFDDPESTKLGPILDRFRREVITSDLSDSHRAGLARQTEGLERFLGRDLDLSDREPVRRDWKRWIRLRSGLRGISMPGDAESRRPQFARSATGPAAIRVGAPERLIPGSLSLPGPQGRPSGRFGRWASGQRQRVCWTLIRLAALKSPAIRIQSGRFTTTENTRPYWKRPPKFGWGRGRTVPGLRF